MIKHKKLLPEYRRYLQSPRWKVLKEKALKLAGGKCQDCGSGALLVVHHLRYSYKWRDEPIKDLKVLCRSCHYKFHHGKEKKWRQVKRIITYYDGYQVEITNIKPFFAALLKDDKNALIKSISRLKR